MYKEYKPYDPFTPFDANSLLRQGRIPVANAGERAQITNPTEGMEVYRLDLHGVDRFDGTKWVTLDTGWIPLGALNSGWAVQAPDSVDYRIINRVLYLRGRLTATASAGTSVLANPLPADARPVQDAAKLIGDTAGTGSTRVGAVTVTGTIVIYKGASAMPAVPLDALGGIPLG